MKIKVICAVTVTVAVVIAMSVMCSPQVSGYETHLVHQGETIWGIAKEYNPNYENMNAVIYELLKVNDINSLDLIYPGDFILVPIMAN
jgi:hypothetical protein